MHGLLELGRLSSYALAQWTELTLHDAQRLLAALELGRRVHATRSRRTRRLRSRATSPASSNPGSHTS
ncbi:hypothetical protein WMF01_39125 [Sorangium sp. So ce1667]